MVASPHWTIAQGHKPSLCCKFDCQLSWKWASLEWEARYLVAFCRAEEAQYRGMCFLYTDGGTRSGSPNTAPLYTGFQLNRGYLKKGLRLDENNKVIYHTNILIVKMFTNFEQNSPAKLFNYFSAWFINYTHSLISFALYRWSGFF